MPIWSGQFIKKPMVKRKYPTALFIVASYLFSLLMTSMT